MPDFVILLIENTKEPGWSWEVAHYRNYLDVRASGKSRDEKQALAEAMPFYRSLDARPGTGDDDNLAEESQ